MTSWTKFSDVVASFYDALDAKDFNKAQDRLDAAKELIADTFPRNPNSWWAWADRAENRLKTEVEISRNESREVA